MWKLTIVLALAVLCSAQDHPPKVSETFTTMTEVHMEDRRDHRHVMGTGEWNRDESKKMAMDTLEIKINGTVADFFERLEDYSMKKEYNYKKNSSGEYCEVRDMRSDEFLMVWDWVEKAHEHKHEDPRTHKEMDFWELRVGSLDVELVVDDAAKDIPVALFEHHREDDREVRFMGFKPVEPDPSKFAIPAKCKQ